MQNRNRNKKNVHSTIATDDLFEKQNGNVKNKQEDEKN